MMARPYTMHDPKDRSPNSPSVLVNSTQILGYFNQRHEGKKQQNVTDPVKDWYKKEAISSGWSSVTFAGNQCVLHANVTIAKS
jgi:hypothetical protein